MAWQAWRINNDEDSNESEQGRHAIAKCWVWVTRETTDDDLTGVEKSDASGSGKPKKDQMNDGELVHLLW